MQLVMIFLSGSFPGVSHHGLYRLDGVPVLKTPLLLLPLYRLQVVTSSKNFDVIIGTRKCNEGFHNWNAHTARRTNIPVLYVLHATYNCSSTFRRYEPRVICTAVEFLLVRGLISAIKIPRPFCP